MEELVQIVKDAVKLLLEKFTLFYRTAPAGVLQLTGVLGLAAVVAGYVHIRGNASGRSNGNRTSNNSQRTRNASQPRDANSNSTTGSNAGDPTSAALKTADATVQLSETARQIRKRLVGIKKITLSTLGVVLRQESADQPKTIDLVTDSVDVLKEILLVADVYLITQVFDDAEESAVLAALEKAGLIGNTAGKLKRHKSLFCSTVEGKVSIVRQIEPDLHIDGHRSTVEDLKRFMPQLLHVHSASCSEVAKGPNVSATTGLKQYFLL